MFHVEHSLFFGGMFHVKHFLLTLVILLSFSTFRVEIYDGDRLVEKTPCKFADPDSAEKYVYYRKSKNQNLQGYIIPCHP